MLYLMNSVTIIVMNVERLTVSLPSDSINFLRICNFITVQTYGIAGTAR